MKNKNTKLKSSKVIYISTLAGEVRWGMKKLENINLQSSIINTELNSAQIFN